MANIERLSSIPSPREDWKLTEGNKKTGTLTYTNINTKATIIVPNVWYNQTVDMRVEAVDFYSETTNQAAYHIMRYAKNEYDKIRSATYHELSKKLKKVSVEMKKTQTVLC